jgi:ferredoxin
VRKSKLPLKKLYTFVSHFLKRVGPNRQAKKKGGPQKYQDALITTLWLFQILKFSLLKRSVSEGCTSCGACAGVCQGNASTDKPDQWEDVECYYWYSHICNEYWRAEVQRESNIKKGAA